MSWSTYTNGSKAQCLAEIAKQLENYKNSPCGEPEETLRQEGMALAVKVIEANPDDVASVNVQCHGSAYTVDGVQISNSIQISVSVVAKS